jgi:hypothetical protein
MSAPSLHFHYRNFTTTTSLSESITALERGFYLKQGYYNGINLAYLLNARVVKTLKNGKKDETIADFVVANRVRQDVIRYTTPLLESMKEEEKTTPPDENKNNEAKIKRYWVVASQWEAAIGLNDEVSTSKWENEAKAMQVADWMQETRESQGAKLRALLTTYNELIGKDS